MTKRLAKQIDLLIAQDRDIINAALTQRSHLIGTRGYDNSNVIGNKTLQFDRIEAHVSQYIIVKFHYDVIDVSNFLFHNVEDPVGVKLERLRGCSGLK